MRTDYRVTAKPRFGCYPLPNSNNLEVVSRLYRLSPKGVKSRVPSFENRELLYNKQQWRTIWYQLTHFKSKTNSINRFVGSSKQKALSELKTGVKFEKIRGVQARLLRISNRNTHFRTSCCSFPGFEMIELPRWARRYVTSSAPFGGHGTFRRADLGLSILAVSQFLLSWVGQLPH